MQGGANLLSLSIAEYTLNGCTGGARCICRAWLGRGSRLCPPSRGSEQGGGKGGDRYPISLTDRYVSCSIRNRYSVCLLRALTAKGTVPRARLLICCGRVRGCAQLPVGTAQDLRKEAHTISAQPHCLGCHPSSVVWPIPSRLLVPTPTTRP